MATAQVWAARVGVSTPRRPKKLTEKLRQLAISRLRKGAPKEQVAQLVHVSIQSITMLLRTEPGLHDTWKMAVFRRRRHQARETWTIASQANRPTIPSELRARYPAEYAWLHRNDRAWFTNALGILNGCRRTNNSKIDWNERDVRLAQAVLGVRNSHEAQQGSNLALPDLCNQIPELKGRLSKLGYLPKTQAALAQVLGKPKRVAKPNSCQASGHG